MNAALGTARRRAPSQDAGVAFALVMAAVLSGCTGNLADPRLAPVAATDMGLGNEAAPNVPTAWWTAMGDPQLDRIMADALAASPDLDAAIARVGAARAAVEVSRAEGRPQASVDAQEQRTRLSERYITPPPYAGSTQWDGQIAANLSWMLDFWSKQATAVRQARASAQAATLDADAARLALRGSIAQTYVELVRAERVIAVSQALIVQRQSALRMVEAQIHANLASRLDGEAARTNLLSAEQALVRAGHQRVLAVHALAALAGRGADYYPTIGAASVKLDAALPLPTTLPADLLARRPDIAAALARVDAAREGRELARKAFYPDINLMGMMGVQALGIGNLFSTDARVYGAGAALHLPLFEGGKLRAEHSRATANLDLAIAEYNGQVIQAVHDTADALTTVDSNNRDLAAQRGITNGLLETLRLNRIRVNSGLNSRLDIIGSELNLLNAEVSVANLEADSILARVRLLIAVGGDFAPTADSARQPT